MNPPFAISSTKLRISCFDETAAARPTTTFL
jgi:hypothetical protein